MENWKDGVLDGNYNNNASIIPLLHHSVKFENNILLILFSDIKTG